MTMPYAVSDDVPANEIEGLDREQATLAQAIAVMARLRAPDGCPWDREQTLESIRKHTLEETYEVFDAIERRDWADLRDELGDLLLQVLFYSQIAADLELFSVADVAATLTAKLKRRHPHIFPDADGQLVRADDADAVNRHWERIKREEQQAKLSPNANGKATQTSSTLDDLSRHMPAMLEAEKLGARAAKVGFDWPDVSGLFAKMREELDELEVEGRREVRNEHDVEMEFGDLLFTAANLARQLRLQPEFALRRANAKFRARFGAMERSAGGSDALRGMSADELEEAWQRAKLETAAVTE